MDIDETYEDQVVKVYGLEIVRHSYKVQAAG